METRVRVPYALPTCPPPVRDSEPALVRCHAVQNTVIMVSAPYDVRPIIQATDPSHSSGEVIERVDMRNDRTYRPAIDTEQTGTAVADLIDEGHQTEAAVRLVRLLPPDQRDVLVRLDDDQRLQLIEQLSPDTLGPLIDCLETEDAVDLVCMVPSSALPFVLDAASPDIAADVLKDLPEVTAAEAIERMETGNEVAALLTYEDDDAGGLMTPEFIALPERMTVSQAMSAIRRWADEYDSRDIELAYVVGRREALIGSVGLGSLVLAHPYQLISLIMNPDVISVEAETDQEEVARLMERYDLQRIPVTDDSGRLLGSIGVEDIIDVVEDEATEDMYRMIGVPETEKISGSFWRSVRGRLPWLCLNLGTALLAGLVVTMFESTMARAVTLAAFLPVIAGQGGIAGTQTLTLIVRSIALGEIGIGGAWRLLAKELGLGVVHGVVVGALVAVVALLWHQNEYIALVVGGAMVVNMMVAGVSGVAVPLGLRALKIDPALGSAVAVTTLTDVIGFLIYLGLAALMIGQIAG